MKTLSQFINEALNSSILNIDIEGALKTADIKLIHLEISKFIDKYYRTSKGYTISNEPNEDGKYVVDATSNAVVKNKRLTSLTNEMFVWGKVNGWFDCRDCDKLTSLDGCPKYVEAYFSCANTGITSLDGCPTNVNIFTCNGCKKTFTKKDVTSRCEVRSGEINL